MTQLQRKVLRNILTILEQQHTDFFRYLRLTNEEIAQDVRNLTDNSTITQSLLTQNREAKEWLESMMEDIEE
jgi:hypothetical protein